MSSTVNVLRFKFENFANLPSEPNKGVNRLKTDKLGNSWRLNLYPGGTNSTPSAGGPYVSCYLSNKGRNNITAKYSFVIRDPLGKSYWEKNFETYTFEVGGNGHGGSLVLRSKLFNQEKSVLVNEALLMDVHIQIKPGPNILHVPRNPFGMNMLKLLENDDDSDVSFMVKKTIIPAHMIILKMNAPVLYDFCEGEKNGKRKHIPIKDITPKLFRIILRYIYGGDPPDSVTIDFGKELIVTADKYGIIGLKLAVETTLVEALLIDHKNVADWLLFADSMNCALLKEHATSYFVARAVDLINSEYVSKLNESPKIMNELMKEVSTVLVDDSRYDNAGRNMSVNELRKKLDVEGLDVDGSKETLISRLNDCNKRQRTE